MTAPLPHAQTCLISLNSYVEDLEVRVTLLERSQSCSIAPVGSAEQPRPLQRQSVTSELQSVGPSSKPNSLPRLDKFLTSLVLIPEPAMTSSLRFGTSIKCLSTDDAPTPRRQQPSVVGEYESPDNAYCLLSPDKHPAENNAIEWPDEDRAQSLLETFLNYLGTVQHLIDPREFSDKMAAIYEAGASQRIVSTLWHVEFLLVMAIGELLQGLGQHDGPLPGAQYFQEALSRLPGITALRSAGVLAIEVLCLAAFYLQCADCKEDAYVYVSFRAIFHTCANSYQGRPWTANGCIKWHGEREWSEKDIGSKA